jgi:hypothetical protein
MDLVRRGIPLTSVYNFTLPTNVSGECSCQNPLSGDTCCMRYVHRSHKMGHDLIRSLLGGYFPHCGHCLIHRSEARDNFLVYQNAYAPETYSDLDFRVVFGIRDLYSTLISGKVMLQKDDGKRNTLIVGLFYPTGYLYHKGGQECWPGSWLGNATWQSYLSYKLDPPGYNLTLCQYLKDAPEESGMRAYIDWALPVKYS